MDDITACAAVIELAEGDNIIVSACDDKFCKLMGWPVERICAFPVAFDDIFPGSIISEFREKLLSCFTSNRSDDAGQICDLRDGTLWWRFSLKPITDRNTRVSARRILVTGSDMMAKMKIEEAPETAAPRYHALVDLAYDAIVTMDSRHNITLFNRAAENLFGYSSQEILGQPIVTLLPEKYRAGHPQKVQQFSDSYQPGLRQATPPKMDGSNSVYGRHRDGTVIPVEIAVSKIRMNDEIEFMAIVRDIRDRAQLMELLKRQAATDALTDLPNRREFVDFIKSTLDASEGLSVFILDVDLFKKINDRYGHDIGDEVLRVLAKVGSSMINGTNLFARWGGEEFVAAFPGVDAKFAYQVADELRQRYERQEFEHAWRVKPIPFTVSIGVTASEAGEADVDQLMKRADRALYAAKASGRNRVELG